MKKCVNICRCKIERGTHWVPIFTSALTKAAETAKRSMYMKDTN